LTERARPKVLVVEDDPDELELFGSLLEAHGFEVALAATAAEGIAKLRENVFDFLLVDYNLPDGTGTAMIRDARKQGVLDGTPACLATAYPFPDRDPDMLLLRKPVDVATLVRTAHEAARRHRREG